MLFPALRDSYVAVPDWRSNVSREELTEDPLASIGLCNVATVCQEADAMLTRLAGVTVRKRALVIEP